MRSTSSPPSRIDPDYPRCPNGSAGNFLSKSLKNFTPQAAQTILRSEIGNDFSVQFAQHHKFRTLLLKFHFKKHCSPHDALSHLPPQLILNRQQAIVFCQSFRTCGRAAFQIVRVDCRRKIAEETRFRIAASVRKHHRIPRSPRQRDGFERCPSPITPFARPPYTRIRPRCSSQYLPQLLRAIRA